MTKLQYQGSIKVVAVRLTSDGGQSVDISKLFQTASIYEDIFANSMSGHITMTETFNLPEVVPIIGEETIEFEFKSYKSHANRTFKKAFRVTKVSNYVIDKNNSMVSYTIDFISSEFEKNQKLRLNRSFGSEKTPMLASDIVSEVCDKMLGIPKFKLTSDTTKFPRNIVCSNWSPFQLFNHLAETDIVDPASQVVNKASTYLFYEDRTGFKFIPIAKLMEDRLHDSDTMRVLSFDPVLKTNTLDVQTPENQVIDFHIEKFANNLDNTMNGMYSNRYVYHDIINKTLTESIVDYSNVFDAMSHPDGKRSYSLRTYRTQNTKESTLLLPAEYHYGNDLSGTRKWKQERRIALQEFKNYNLVVTVSGSTRFKLGSILDCKLPSPRKKSDGTTDNYAQLSGKYLATKIRHDFSMNHYYQTMNLSKGSQRKI